MNRETLVNGLRNVDPARSDKIGAAKGFWFTGKRLLAFNSEIALSVPCETEYTGSVQDTLLPLLSSSAADECTFETPDDKGNLLVKVGASKFKLQTLGMDDLVFKMPKLPEDKTFVVNDVPEFVYALKACTRSLGNDVSEKEFKGVTFIVKGKTLHMFGWERVSLTHAQVKIKGEAGFERVLIPTAVVNQFLRIADGATEFTMSIDDKRLLCKCEGVTLWGRIEDQERNPRDFLAYSSGLQSGYNSMIRIDGENFKKFSGIIDRACIITQAAVDVSKTKISWVDGKMLAVSKSSRGRAEEAASPAKGAGTNPDVVVNVDPERLRRALDLTQMAMTEKAVCFSNDDGTLLYFVSGS